MKYFAKYLPVEGEIKEGDIILDIPPSTLTGIAGKGKYDGCRKVKLFLCSRDIQVGDKVYPTRYYNDAGSIVGGFKDGSKTIFYFEKHNPANIKHHHHVNNWGKVIGEISPDAIWVKEGDEFEHEDLIANGIGINWDSSHTNLKFKVKCSQCKTFH